MGADFFVTKRGALLLLIGAASRASQSRTHLDRRVHLSLYGQSLGLTLAVVRLQGVMLGSLAQIFFDFTGSRTAIVLRRFAYTKTTLLALFAFVLGVAAEVPFWSLHGSGTTSDSLLSSRKRTTWQ